MGQFHFNQGFKLGTGLKLHWHIVVKHPHTALGFDLPQAFECRGQLPWVKRLLRGEALLFTGHIVLAHLAKVTLEQVAIDQGVAVIERQ